MQNTELITLSNLYVVSSQDGEQKNQNVRVEMPSPCAQANAEGNLGSCALEDMLQRAEQYGASMKGLFA